MRTARGFRLNTLKGDVLTVGPCHIVILVLTRYFQNLHVESNPRLAAKVKKKNTQNLPPVFRIENVNGLNLLILVVSNDFVIVGQNTIFMESPQ